MKLSRNGAHKSPDDGRDWIAERIYPKMRNLNFPEILDLRPHLEPIRNQGSQGSCVAQSLACMKEYQEKMQVEFRGYMSPQFIYNNRSNQDSEGMYCRDALTIVRKFGSCSESKYSYGTIESKNEIKKSALDEALGFRIESYAKVLTKDGVKIALNKNGPCIIAFPCYNYSKQFWIKSIFSQEESGHCVVIVGYNEKGFILRNSWGRFWNVDGYTLYPYEQFGSHWEIWTSIDAQSSILDVPESNENPEDNHCCVVL